VPGPAAAPGPTAAPGTAAAGSGAGQRRASSIGRAIRQI
jgi:hypothetical protein